MALIQFPVGYWEKKVFRDLDNNEKLIYFLLYSHPSINELGIVRSNLQGLAADFNLDLNLIISGIKKLETKKLIKTEPFFNLILITDFLKYNPIEDKNKIIIIVNEFNKLQNCQLKEDLKKTVASHLEGKKGLLQFFKSLLKNKPKKNKSHIKETEPTPIQLESDEEPILTIPLKEKDDEGNPIEYPIFQKDIEELQNDFIEIDVLSALKEIKQWNIANPGRRKTKRGIKRHIIRWLMNKQQKIQAKKQQFVQEIDKEFSIFMSNYPKKENEFGAWQIWKTLKDQNELPELEFLLKKIDEFKKSKNWKDGYIPTAKNWLKEKRWTDSLKNIVVDTEDLWLQNKTIPS